MYLQRLIHVFIGVFFVIFCSFVQSEKVSAQETSPVPTFTSIGDCQANEICPTSEPTVEIVQEPTIEPPQPQGNQANDENKNKLISIIQQLIDLIKQLLGGGGQGGCPTDTQVSGYSADDTVTAFGKGKGKKGKWKKKKKGLYKRLKCPGQKQDSGQQRDQNGGDQNGGQQGGDQQQDGGQQDGGQQPAPSDPPADGQQGDQQGGDQQQGGGQQDGGQQQEQPTVAPTNPPAAGGQGGDSGVTGACSGGVQATEPAHDYTRTTYGSKTVNVRTRNMLQIAEGFAGDMGVPTPFTLTQGSYSTGVAASAGTHDGGGVVDISVNSMDTTQRNNAVRALRLAGFAAWLRSPAEGFAYHIHANAIGDREMAPVAMSQVDNYFDGLNGLAGNGRDTAPASVGRPIPSWATAYGTCN